MIECVRTNSPHLSIIGIEKGGVQNLGDAITTVIYLQLHMHLLKGLFLSI